MLKPSVLLSASAAVGRKLYAWPTVTDVAGVPLIVGARFADEPPTVIENRGSPALMLPSLTRISMFEYVPAFAAVGVPVSCPVMLLKDAHAGRLMMPKRTGSPLPSLAVGTNRYVEPTATEVAGVPEMTGVTLLRRKVARIENLIAALELLPSLTEMLMLFHSPTALGVPLSRPVDVEKDAHDGLFWIA